MKHMFSALRHFYGNRRLQSKFTLVLLVAAAIPVLIFGLFFYGRLYDMVVSYTIRQEQDASADTAPQIADTIQEVLTVCDEISDDPFFRTLFSSFSDSSLEELSSREEAAAFSKKSASLCSGGLITSIRIYADLPAEDCPLFTKEATSSLFAPMKDVRGTYWYGIFRGAPQTRELYCPSFYLGPREQSNHGDLAYIRPLVMHCGDGEIPCYLAVYYSSAPLSAILSDNLELDGSVSYIINERDALVASSDESLAGIYHLDYDSIRDAFMSSNNFIERTILDEKVYAGFYSIAKPGWFMVTVLPSRPLIAEGNLIVIRYALLYGALMLLTFFLASMLSRSVTRRISSVIDQMRTVRQGPPVPMPSPDYHDEVGDLIDTYNFMTREMNRLIEDQGKAAEDLRIAEFNSLQAQINPHFLYNTMDMINWLAQQGRTDEVSTAVQDLSRFYKLTLSRRQSISTIAQEEEHVSIYLRLQNMRYHDSISFVSDIPDELMEYLIPKLTLQPVIENAVLHGILEKDSKSGTIVLTGWMEENDIVLLISDDGVGIPPEKLPHILSGGGSSSSGGTNIAVFNTHRRLQILYGASYGLSYSSEQGKGTEVLIRIPAQKEYQKPYVQNSPSYTNRSLSPLVAVTSKEHTLSANAVSPETLLDYNQRLTQDLYHIHSLHQISSNLPRGENLYVLTHEVSEDFPSHTHDYFELNYVCSGSLINVTDGSELYMSAGDLVFLNPKAVHSLIYRQPQTIMVNFCLLPGLFDRTLHSFYEDDNLISAFFREEQENSQNYIFFSLGHDLYAQSVLSMIIREYAQNGFHQSFSVEALFLSLFSYLASTSEFSYDGIDSRTHQMVQYVKEHGLQESAQDIAAHFACTAAQLDEHLKKHTGRSLHSYTEEIRLNRALDMLENLELNVYQIAADCGYKDAEEFFDAFYRRFSISPADYRKQFL